LRSFYWLVVSQQSATSTADIRFDVTVRSALNQTIYFPYVMLTAGAYEVLVRARAPACPPACLPACPPAHLLATITSNSASIRQLPQAHQLPETAAEGLSVTARLQAPTAQPWPAISGDCGNFNRSSYAMLRCVRACVCGVAIEVSRGAGKGHCACLPP